MLGLALTMQLGQSHTAPLSIGMHRELYELRPPHSPSQKPLVWDSCLKFFRRKKSPLTLQCKSCALLEETPADRQCRRKAGCQLKASFVASTVLLFNSSLSHHSAALAKRVLPTEFLALLLFKHKCFVYVRKG